MCCLVGFSGGCLIGLNWGRGCVEFLGMARGSCDGVF